MSAPHAGVGPGPYNQVGCQPPSRGGRVPLAMWDLIAPHQDLFIRPAAHSSLRGLCRRVSLDQYRCASAQDRILPHSSASESVHAPRRS